MDIDATKLEEFKKTKEYRSCAAEVDLYKNVFVEIYNMLKDIKQKAKISDDYKLHLLIGDDLRVYFEKEKGNG